MAGIGEFNGSFVEQTLSIVNGILPYFVLIPTYGFVKNPEFSTPANPVDCLGNRDDCDSYLFPGGFTNHPSFYTSDPNPYVVVHSSPAI